MFSSFFLRQAKSAVARIIILTLAVCATLCPSSAQAAPQHSPAIMAVIASDLGKIEHNRTGMKIIKEKMEAQFPPPAYRIIFGDQVNERFRDFLHDDDPSSLKRIDKETLAEFGQRYGYDYVALLVFDVSAVQKVEPMYLIIGSWYFVFDVELTAKIVDAPAGVLIAGKTYTQQVVSQKSTAILPFTLLPAFSVAPPYSSVSVTRAWQDGVAACLDQFFRDL